MCRVTLDAAVDTFATGSYRTLGAVSRAFETGTYRAESVGRPELAVARPASLHRVVLAGESVGEPARSRRRFAESAQIGLLLKNRLRRTGRPRPISRPSRTPSSTTPPGSLERRLRPDIAVPRGDRCRRPDSGAPPHRSTFGTGWPCFSSRLPAARQPTPRRLMHFVLRWAFRSCSRKRNTGCPASASSRGSDSENRALT